MRRKYAIAAAIWAVVLLVLVLGSGKREKSADLLLITLSLLWTIGWAVWIVVLWVRHRREPDVRERLVSWDAVFPRWLTRFFFDEEPADDKRPRSVTFRSSG